MVLMTPVRVYRTLYIVIVEGVFLVGALVFVRFPIVTKQVHQQKHARLWAVAAWRTTPILVP